MFVDCLILNQSPNWFTDLQICLLWLLPFGCTLGLQNAANNKLVTNLSLILASFESVFLFPFPPLKIYLVSRAVSWNVVVHVLFSLHFWLIEMFLLTLSASRSAYCQCTILSWLISAVFLVGGWDQMLQHSNWWWIDKSSYIHL